MSFSLGFHSMYSLQCLSSSDTETRSQLSHDQHSIVTARVSLLPIDHESYYVPPPLIQRDTTVLPVLPHLQLICELLLCARARIQLQFSDNIVSRIWNQLKVESHCQSSIQIVCLFDIVSGVFFKIPNLNRCYITRINDKKVKESFPFILHI